MLEDRLKSSKLCLWSWQSLFGLFWQSRKYWTEVLEYCSTALLLQEHKHRHQTLGLLDSCGLGDSGHSGDSGASGDAVEIVEIQWRYSVSAAGLGQILAEVLHRSPEAVGLNSAQTGRAAVCRWGCFFYLFFTAVWCLVADRHSVWFIYVK